MSELWNDTGFAGYKCDHCGKEHSGGDGHYDPVYGGRRPHGWIAMVVFYPWFDGSEGDPVMEWNYCTVACAQLHNRDLTHLGEIL